MVRMSPGFRKLARAARLNEDMKVVMAQRDDLIREAVEDGFSQREVARIVGISHQRVAQIVKDGK